MLDEGEIVAQKRAPVMPGDTPQTLAERVLAVEHEALVEAVARFARAAPVMPAR
jgi:folate-dependent phosphoribosylglycinamide formyltransferase PurN